MSRISRHQLFMGIAELSARRATCFRRAVGAIIVHDNRPVSLGYNGPPSGEPHCTGATCPVEGVCKRSIHAEVNAIERCRSLFTYSFTGSMYVTESPCPSCADMIAHGTRLIHIDRVYYLHEYRLTEGLSILLRAGVEVYRMTSSGYIINYATGQLINGD